MNEIILQPFHVGNCNVESRGGLDSMCVDMSRAGPQCLRSVRVAKPSSGPSGSVY